MKMKMKNLLSALVLVLSGLAMVAFLELQDQKKGESWCVPAEYANMNNPYSGQEDLIPLGKSLWVKYCKSCHGNLGLGDGLRAVNLHTYPGNFSDTAFQAQSDGVIYYQSIIGRDEMPGYETKIPDEKDRWAIVNYIRTLK